MSMEDLEFQQELEGVRHKELLAALRAIYSKLPETQESIDLRPIMATIEKAIKKDASLQELKKLTSAIKEVVDSKEPSPTSWDFSIERDEDGYIKKVSAKKS